MVELKRREQIERIREADWFVAGARSVYLGYHPSFGAMPYLGGWVADSVVSFQVAARDAEAARLIEVTESVAVIRTAPVTSPK